jgi:hypothetical protein
MNLLADSARNRSTCSIRPLSKARFRPYSAETSPATSAIPATATAPTHTLCRRTNFFTLYVRLGGPASTGSVRRYRVMSAASAPGL